MLAIAPSFSGSSNTSLLSLGESFMIYRSWSILNVFLPLRRADIETTEGGAGSVGNPDKKTGLKIGTQEMRRTAIRG
jgi:hypothetical protein